MFKSLLSLLLFIHCASVGFAQSQWRTEKKWAFKTGDGVDSSPAIGNDGTIYVGSLDKNLYAIETSSNGPADSPWPMFGQNNKRSGLAQRESNLALGTAVLVNGFVVDLHVNFGGSGYTTAPNVEIIGGGGSGATAKAVLSEGAITDLKVINAGIGYTTAPIVKIDPPHLLPIRAVVESEIINGFMVGLNLIEEGWGYGFPPKVQITGGGGSGAQALATVKDGKIANLKIISAGSGYTSTPKVLIAAPKPEIFILNKEDNIIVRTTAYPGFKCRLESSLDLINWNKADDSIASSNEVDFNVSEVHKRQFYRVIWLN